MKDPLTSSINNRSTDHLKFGIEFMSTASPVYAIIEGLPTPSLPKHARKPDHSSIRECHQLLMANAVLVESDLGSGKNGYIELVLLPKKYNRMAGVPFVRPPNLEITAIFPIYKPTREEMLLLREHKKERRPYGKCRVVDTKLKYQSISVFKDPYLLMMENMYTGYATNTKLELVQHLYLHYACISSTDMSENDERLRPPYNPEETL